MRSATSMESSRRDLSNDVAEHRHTLKNNQNTYYPRFSFIPNPKQVQHSQKRVFCFYCAHIFVPNVCSQLKVYKKKEKKCLVLCASHVAICNRRDMGPMLDTSARCRVPMSGRR